MAPKTLEVTFLEGKNDLSFCLEHIVIRDIVYPLGNRGVDHLPAVALQEFDEILV
jgi:hypothetical protein